MYVHCTLVFLYCCKNCVSVVFAEATSGIHNPYLEEHGLRPPVPSAQVCPPEPPGMVAPQNVGQLQRLRVVQGGVSAVVLRGVTVEPVHAQVHALKLPIKSSNVNKDVFFYLKNVSCRLTLLMLLSNMEMPSNFLLRSKSPRLTEVRLKLCLLLQTRRD